MLGDAILSEPLLASIRQVRDLAPETALSMVANVKSSPAEFVDYNETSVTTEHFSSAELGSMMGGFREIGFFVNFHGGELDFIKDDLKKMPDEVLLPQVVYNTAQSGTGPGRKSLIPAYCALRGIRVCNSDAYVMALARQKFHVHCILKRAGLPTAATWCFWPPTGWQGDEPPNGINVIAKATYESASIGLTKECVGTYDADFEQVLRRKCEIYRQPFIVQEFISGYEVEVPLIEFEGMKALDIVSVELGGDVDLGPRVLYHDIIDAESYRYSKSDHIQISLKRELARTAELAASILGLHGVGRIDFRLDKRGHVCITDVAASPHLVPHSSFTTAFAWYGHSHSDMLAAMIGANLNRWESH